jgi:hypothetical protein
MGAVPASPYHFFLKILNQRRPVLFFQKYIQPPVDNKISVKNNKDKRQNYHHKPVGPPEAGSKRSAHKKCRHKTQQGKKCNQYNVKKLKNSLEFHRILLRLYVSIKTALPDNPIYDNLDDRNLQGDRIDSPPVLTVFSGGYTV